MSSIPYNYGSYIDAKVSMTDTGHVSAGKQIQSPASAGSRGLAKTTQFTKDPTQMKMGNSPIAESMVEIRNILNRIDGVNVPTNEAPKDSDIDYAKLMLQISAMKDKIAELPIDDDRKTSALTALGQVEDDLAMDESAVKEDAGEDEKVVDMLRNIKQHLENHPNMSEHPSLVALDQLADDLESGDKPADYESAVREDSDYNNFEKNDEYADNVEKYGDVDKAPLTPQERQQFANWVKQTADVYAEKAMEGVADIGDDPDMIDGDKNLIPRIKAYLKKSYDANDIQGFADAVSDVEKKFGDEDLLMNDTGYQEASDFSQHAVNYLSGFKLLSSKGKDYTVKTIRGVLDHIDDDPHIASAMLLFQQEFEGTPLQKKVSRKQATESVSEHEDELSRLKELSGIEENAKVNFSPEQIKQLMMWNKKYSVYSGKNGDELPSGLVKANTDSGITSDGYEENEVKQYEKMFGKEEFDWDDSQHGEFQEKSKITGGMMSDLEKIVGVGNADDEYTLAEIGEKILGMSFGDTYEEQYKPFPEEDEMTFEDDDAFYEAFGELGFPEDENELFDAEYRGRKVPLNKPMRGDVKKFKVYVKDPKSGNVKKVNFGHGGTSAKRPTMRIRKSNPKARKSFRARHNCANPGPKTKARYWSCRKW